jgi:hypothetical protein
MHPESIPTVTRRQPPELCSCEHPLPREHAEQKGAARTMCDRCGHPVPLRLGMPAA